PGESPPQPASAPPPPWPLPPAEPPSAPAVPILRAPQEFATGSQPGPPAQPATNMAIPEPTVPAVPPEAQRVGEGMAKVPEEPLGPLEGKPASFVDALKGSAALAQDTSTALPPAAEV